MNIYPPATGNTSVIRIRVLYAALAVISAVFVVRLFYLQIIQYDHYRKAALQSQFKEYEIPAERGIIEAHDGDKTVPLVLNETLYTVFADPSFITDPQKDAALVAGVVGGDSRDYEKAMRAKSRYAVLATRVSKDKKVQLDSVLDKAGVKGIGTRDATYRTYPQGSLAAQLLGFVDNDGQGRYGLEQDMQKQLSGTPGQLKAITDAHGVPLVSNKDNVVTQPVDGQRVTLTLDIPLQRKLEDTLQAGLKRAQSKSGSALILDPSSGAIVAMANYPTYNPGEFYKVDNQADFTNAAVSSPLEVGSVMKVFTTAAALDSGSVAKDQTYNDPGHFDIDGHTIRNIEEDGGPGQRSVADILKWSLNTGATWLLMQMGGGQVNSKARSTWHSYMVDHYQFGKPTGVEQGYEDGGIIPDPSHGQGLNLQYANTSFGQGMTATPLQIGAALGGVLNGGTYYRPHVVEQVHAAAGADGKPPAPAVVRTGVVSAQTSATIIDFMRQTAVRNIKQPFRPGFIVGGKTGTAQIADPQNGGYFEDKYNGMYTGFVGGDMPQYVIVVRVNEPKINGYAGFAAAQPLFVDVVNDLLDAGMVTPKRS
jgi:stage V sporulation protein D (sporulation-specific penicillin-binding protein)